MGLKGAGIKTFKFRELVLHHTIYCFVTYSVGLQIVDFVLFLATDYLSQQTKYDTHILTCLMTINFFSYNIHNHLSLIEYLCICKIQ